jgi:CO/xanthine dehydrogenase Mo-binding subunit
LIQRSSQWNNLTYFQGFSGKMGVEQPSMTTEHNAVGGSNARIDTLEKVTGQTAYVEDMHMPGLLAIAVVRSPYHHARLLSIDPAAAEKCPGVVRVITHLDIPGLNGLEGYSRDEPVLTPTGDTLRQKGAPIALVVAETPVQAQAAARAVCIQVETLPHTFDVSAAVEPGAVAIYPSGNVLASEEVHWGDLDAELAGSDLILESCYETSSQEHSALERDATLAYVDPNGLLTVYGGTHEPHWQQGFIAQTLGIDPSRVRVILPPTGGSFGNRQDPWPLVAAGLAAYLVGRPVRLAYTRREVFDATPKRHPYTVRYRIGATASGRLTGYSARIDANTGGYDSAGYWIPNYAITSSGGAYTWRAVDAAARTVYTNAAKCGQFRGYGAPQSTFALECSLDEICQRIGLDPLEFRLQNALSQSGRTSLGYPAGESIGYPQVLETVRPYYREFIQEAEDFNAAHAGEPQRMAVGVSGMWYRFGKSGSLVIHAHAELAQDGHFVIYCSAPEYGQGIATVMVQLGADVLGVPRERIELVNADTLLTPDSGIQGGSRATYFVGSAVRAALDVLRMEIFGIAAEILDCAPAGLSLTDTQVCAWNNQGCSVSLAELAREFDRLGKPRRVIGTFDLTPLFPDEARPHHYAPLFVTGAQAAEVIVDLETGQARVSRVAAAHDVGRAVNPPGAVGQIQGAILMGIGSALREEYIPGASSGFMDYLLPIVCDVPRMDVALVEVPSFHGPLGAKGLGEAAIMPTAPAVINGLSRAIGARIRKIPATPERVLAAIVPADTR